MPQQNYTIIFLIVSTFTFDISYNPSLQKLDNIILFIQKNLDIINLFQRSLFLMFFELTSE